MSLIVAEPNFRIKFHESLKNKIQEYFIDISNVNLYIFNQFIENKKYDQNSIKLLLKLEKALKATFICLHNGDLFNAFKWFDKYRTKRPIKTTTRHAAIIFKLFITSPFRLSSFLQFYFCSRIDTSLMSIFIIIK